MPYSLKQLKSQRDTYIKNIEELKSTAEDKGVGSFANFLSLIKKNQTQAKE